MVWNYFAPHLLIDGPAIQNGLSGVTSSINLIGVLSPELLSINKLSSKDSLIINHYIIIKLIIMKYLSKIV